MAADLDIQRAAVLADFKAHLRRTTHAMVTCTVWVEDGGVVDHRITEDQMTEGDYDRLMRQKPRKTMLRRGRR